VHNLIELHRRIQLKLNHEIYICKSCTIKRRLHLLRGLFVNKVAAFKQGVYTNGKAAGYIYHVQIRNIPLAELGALRTTSLNSFAIVKHLKYGSLTYALKQNSDLEFKCILSPNFCKTAVVCSKLNTFQNSVRLVLDTVSFRK
jgi:hypothetical protein